MPDVAKCSEPGCNRPVHAHGLCNSCYKQKLRNRKKEIIAIYTQHKLKHSKDDIGVERGAIGINLAKISQGIFLENNTLDLETWIERNITLPVGNGYASQRKMNFDIFPHVKDILKLVENPECKRIVLCFAAQSGKSDTIASIAAYLTGYKNRRGIYVLPTDEMLEKVRNTRLFPLLDASRDKVGFDRIENKRVIKFINGNYYYLALASSPGTLAEQTGTSWAIVDEHDEFKQEGKGHNAVDLAEKRMQTSSRRLTIIACTPKRTDIGYTYNYYNRTKRFIEEISCPLCNGWFVPDFYQHFKWPENIDSNIIENDKLAWIECPECGGHITDSMHYFIVTKRKRWKDLNPDLSIAECGFRLPIFLTPNKNWSATVAAYLKIGNDTFAEADFNNSWLAKPKDDKNAMRIDDIDFHKLKGDWLCERHEIPEGVHRLTAGVDVGAHRIWLVLLGWGSDGRKYVIRSEGIDRGEGTESLAEAMSAAVAMCNPVIYKARGTPPKFSGGLIDSGDGNDTENVYEFCMGNYLWKPAKGNSELRLSFEKGETDKSKYRGRFKNLTLWLVNTNQMQTKLRRSFSNARGTPMSVQFAEDAPELLFQHIKNQVLCEIAKKGGKSKWRWQKIGDRDDHLMDALMLAAFGGEIMDLHKRDFENEAPVKPPQANRVVIAEGSIYGARQ
ncbi:hypothetical protein R83H12_00418 [Fibrobacteria bacterium R8-3-H12]